MAYQTRGRDPLFDSNMQEALEKRSKELIGGALVALGIIAALIIGSYHSTDPSWLSATDAPVQNFLGQTGATIAAPLFMIVGKGSWSIPVILLVWGARFLMHRGADRILSRIIFFPIAVALASIYAALLVPGAGWSHAFGLGGLFGDTVTGALLHLSPFSFAFSIKLASLLAAVSMVVVMAFVLGATMTELRETGRFMLLGIVMIYASILSLLGKGASGAVQAAGQYQTRQQEKRAAADVASAATDPVMYAEPQETAAWQDQPQYDVQEDYVTEPAYLEPVSAPAPEKEKTGLLSLMPSLIKRAEPIPEPELVEQMPPEYTAEMPSDDRIKSKIADVIKTRVRRPAAPVVAAPQAAKALARGPQPLVFNPEARPARQEPPLTASATLIPTAPPMTAADVPAAAPSGLSFSSARLVQPESVPQDTVMAHAPRQPIAQQTAHQDTLVAQPPASMFTGAAFEAVPSESMPMHAPKPAAVPVQAEAPAPIVEPVTSYAPAPAPEVHQDPMQLHETYSVEPEIADDYVDEFEAELDAYLAEPVAADPTPAPVAALPYTIPKPEPKKVVQHTQRKVVKPSARARAEAQPALQFDDAAEGFELPPLSLLESPTDVQRHHLSDEALEENARMLEAVLDDYGVKGEIVSVRPGPVVTMYELEPAPGLKASRVIGLSDDIARSMSALSARVSTVPGRSVIGIELPNENREKVVLREILASREFGDGSQKLALALGKDIGGDPMVANLAKMPHLLIAGTTGSGKSVAINTMILSLLYKLTPAECRLIMIDPKMLELSVYDGIPHLLSPVVTDPKKAVVALKWVVGEMEERYRKMSKMGVRNIDGYNGRVADALGRNELFSRTVQTGFDDDTGEPIFETEETTPERMPYIVVVVDEMADLMMVAGKEIEACIQRLAQMARASGIHLIMATQRPSVDVITGTIKANFPTRISFQVTSKIDSRTILGEMGAEQLLGMGDMLYMAGGAKITRCHGPFVSDEEVEEIVNHLKSHGPPQYMSGVVDGPDDDRSSDIDAVLGLGGNTDGEDALYDTAVAIVIKDRKCSTSYIQRKLAIGYNKAARLVEQMEDQGLVSPANHVGKREILVPEQQ